MEIRLYSEVLIRINFVIGKKTDDECIYALNLNYDS